MDVESVAFEGRSPDRAAAGASLPDRDSLTHRRIGAAIRRRRQIMGLSLRALAAACGMSLQQIQKYEVGVSSISAAQLWRMAHALAVPVEQLYGRAADPET